jgi:pyruvate,water dikinase
LIELGLDDKYIDEIEKGISTVAKVIYPKPIIVRFSDFKSNEYKGLEGGSKYEDEENNPMIGFRGVSRYISKEFEQAFRLECRAIKKARLQNDNVYVMLPFVRTTDEVKKCLDIMEDEELKRSKSFKIYIMAEVPSIALIPEEFAKLDIDGASIGSNDLTQLVLGVDRDSALLGRLGYFNEKNPAVLKAIHNIIEGFHKHGKTVSICGQAPSVYSEVVEFLLKEGIDSISVNPDAVEKVRHHVSLMEEKDIPIKVSEVNLNENYEDY